MDRIRDLGNCILVVYLLAFDDVTCYNAVGSNLVTASPSGAAMVIVTYCK